MATLSSMKARGQFSRVINRAAVRKERVVLTERGKRIAAVVPIEDVEVLEKLEERMDREEARRRLADPKDRSISYDMVRRELGLH